MLLEEEWSEGRDEMITQPRTSMRGHQISVASSRDAAGRIMHSEDSVEVDIVQF
jgi:hypothetical protein